MRASRIFLMSVMLVGIAIPALATPEPAPAQSADRDKLILQEDAGLDEETALPEETSEEEGELVQPDESEPDVAPAAVPPAPPVEPIKS